MRKLLEETLEGVYRPYTRADSAYMFGYCMDFNTFGGGNNRFRPGGSEFNPFEFNVPDLVESFKVDLTKPTEQDFTMRSTHNGEGMMNIHRETGDAFHQFSDGGAHIDLGSSHWPKLNIEKNLVDRYDNFLGTKIKGTGGFF